MHQRIYGLDLLRAVAILTVLYFHAYGIIGSHFDQTVYQALVPDGVMLFFVLSGFLIGSILIKTINTTDFEIKDLTNFWKRRWFRTLPAYFVVLAIILLNSYNAGPISFYETSKYFLFIQSMSKSCFLFRESWSLCVEEWFYITIPFLVYFFLKLSSNKKTTILSCIIGVIISVTVFRFYWMNHLNVTTAGEWDYYIHKATITRMDSIMFGMLGAYLNYYEYSIWAKNKNICFVIGISAFILSGLISTQESFASFNRNWCLTFQASATLLLLPKLSSLKEGSGIVYRFFTFISTISYSMYLLNLSPFFIILLPRIKRMFPLSEPTVLFLFLAWTIGASYLLYKYVEQPMMKLRDAKYKSEIRPMATILQNA